MPSRQSVSFSTQAERIALERQRHFEEGELPPGVVSEAVGTTAPGIVARTGKQASVQGAEHISESVHFMHCAAAPIRDIHGNLAGVLDMASEGIAFNFDAASVVGLYDASIENRLRQRCGGKQYGSQCG
jgi:transcriptional regulator of acetoin/glycerol metabolism